MITINLLTNPALGVYVSGISQLRAMTQLDLAHFDAGIFIEHARTVREELDILEQPTRRLSGAISLFEDMAADRMLRPETAAQILERVRSDPQAKLIPGYDRFEPRGYGGYGIVYWAYQEDTGRQVAIKVGRLTPKGASTDSMKRIYTIERLQEVYRREYDFLKDIDSDRIVKVHGTGMTERGKPYIIMEYLGGGNLMRFTERLHNGEIDDSWETLYGIIEQVLECAVVLHQRGIIHNDIKPENYLMGRDGQVKLTDFSFVTTEQAAAQHGTRAHRGTNGHMAIQSTESASKDVYALGSTLYQILTGRTPVKQTSDLGALAAFMFGIMPPSQRKGKIAIPKEVDAFIMKALNSRTTVRFKSAMQMLAAFQKLRPILMRS